MLRKLRTHATAGLLAGLALAACGGPEGDPSAPGSVDDDLGDIRGVEEIASALTAVSDVEFDTDDAIPTNILKVTVGAQTAVIGTRLVDSAILVNGFTELDNKTSTALATSVNVKKIQVTAAAGATVILDFANGTFLKGDSNGPRIEVTFAADTDAFKIRGSKNADTFTVGKEDGNGDVLVAFDKDSYPDIKVIDAPDEFTLSLGNGNDVFNGSIASATASVNYGTGAGPSDRVFKLYGGLNDDTLIGGDEADEINGNEGKDTLSGELGVDTLNGDAGDDTFAEGSANALADGDLINGGDDKDTVSYAGRAARVVVNVDGLAVDGDVGDGGEQDTVAVDVEVVIGTDYNDTLTARAAGSTLNGGLGNDTLIGGAGVDILNGDAGNDDLFGGDNGDTLNGGDGDDDLLAAYDHDGDAGAETPTAYLVDNGADTYDGGAGTDTVWYLGRTVRVKVVLDGLTAGGEIDGTDTLTATDGTGDKVKTTVENVVGTSEDDIFTGSSADNVFVPVEGGDVIRGGAGVDTVDYSTRTAAFLGAIAMDGGATTPATELGGAEGIDIGADVENFKCPLSFLDVDGDPDATASCDVTGNALDNVLEGGPNDDVLDGDAGDDTLWGGAGDDDLICGGGSGDIAYADAADLTPPAGCEL